MTNSEIEKLEEATFFEDDYPDIPPVDIIAYNELRSCADLYRMYVQDILNIQPEFQREIVWNGPSQTRFIDSLIKQLPIPSMCFSLDFKLQKWQVIDGLQRMATIIKFLSNDEWTLSKLEDVDPRISGQPLQNFRNINSDLHELFTRVENLTLPITVIRCDYSKRNHSEYLFTIFHRLNSGGMKLNNQEIRNCIYSGPLNDLLKELNEYPIWMKLNKVRQTGGDRFSRQEIILRFFCLHDRYQRYYGRLAKFLNDYMAENRNITNDEMNKKRILFTTTVDLVYQKIFEGRIPKLTVTVLEALLLGVSWNLEFIQKLDNYRGQNFYKSLISNEEFTEEKLREGLSGKQRVINRLTVAKEIFSGRT